MVKRFKCSFIVLLYCPYYSTSNRQSPRISFGIFSMPTFFDQFISCNSIRLRYLVHKRFCFFPNKIVTYLICGNCALNLDQLTQISFNIYQIYQFHFQIFSTALSCHVIKLLYLLIKLFLIILTYVYIYREMVFSQYKCCYSSQV